MIHVGIGVFQKRNFTGKGKNVHMDKDCNYQVSGVLCLWGVAGVEAVSGCDLWAGAG